MDSRNLTSPSINSGEYIREFIHDKDAQVVRNEEEQASVMKDRSRRRGWQIFVFTIASFKYYILSCVLKTSIIYQVVQRDDNGFYGSKNSYTMML